MSSSLTRHPRAVSFVLPKPTLLAAMLVIAMATIAQAQTVPPAAGAGPNESASERASREGDKVFQWIRMHADKPRKAAAPEKASVASAAPTAPVKMVAKAAPKPVDGGNTETAQPSSKAAPQQQVAAVASKPAVSNDPPISLTAAAATDASAPLASTGSSPQVEIEEDVSLVPVARGEPEFPGALMRQLRKGVVQVAFTVQPDGSVSQAHAVTSSHPRLAPSAVASVSQWKFQPVHHAQQAVVDLGFNLD
jgi:TonB family protein